MKSPKIVIVGSLNMDIVLNLKRMPKVGETIRGQDIHFNRLSEFEVEKEVIRIQNDEWKWRRLPHADHGMVGWPFVCPDGLCAA